MSPLSPLAVATASKGKILLVDDDLALLRACAAKLQRAGYEVVTAENGLIAVSSLSEAPFDAVISDISMPGLDGFGVLKRVQNIDRTLPFILMTGEPTVESAIAAVEHHALRYLVKPFDPQALEQLLYESIQLRRLAEVKRRAEEHVRDQEEARNHATLNESLDRALAGLWMAYQPIVSCAGRCTIAFEALMRSNEPSLPHPGAVLQAAEATSRLPQIGRTVRQRVGTALASLELDVDLYVNLHPWDLLDEDLFDASAVLSRNAPRVVLELTERASLDHMSDLPARIARLRQLGFRIAIDDLGAGYSGLSSFVQLKPEIAKLDMSLVRGIDRDPVRQKLVSSMVLLCRDLGAMVLAEGVETEAERDALLAIHCDVMQGYLFGKPAARMVPVTWPGTAA